MDHNLNPINFSRDIHRQRISKMNKVVSQIEGDYEEDNAYEFQDSVLSCLADLQHLAIAMKEKAIMMEDTLRDLRTSIHGEDIDA